MKQVNIEKPNAQVISFTSLTWFIFVFSTAYYCYLYGVVYAEKDDFSCYIKWALWSWCIWLILIPVTYKKVEVKSKESTNKDVLSDLYSLLKLGIVLCIIALAVQLIGTWLIDGHVLQDVFYYLPTNIKIFVMTVMFAFVFIKKETLKKASCNQESLRCLDNKNEDSLVYVNDIKWLTAYGNYVQIYTADSVFLMRATMKEMDIKLDSQQFIRIHRSHIINKCVIKGIKSKNGQSILNTICGSPLPIGRSYKRKLIQDQLKKAN